MMCALRWISRQPTEAGCRVEKYLQQLTCELWMLAKGIT